jgi:ABC-type Fe3+/spermidine/putrescine transport system ATPase subunit
MIRLTGLRKRFRTHSGGVAAVDGVDLEVPAGKLVTLLGPSGCGKTTTLRLIAGLERPDAGEIWIGGRRVCGPGVFVGAHRRPIGLVFQSYAIWPHMTVLDNVLFPLAVQRPRLRRAEQVRRAMQALDMVHLADLADRPAPALSGGQQQRVALARALVRQPEVLLLDEPLSNLDAALRDRVRDEIRALQQRLGITTVFVTHDQDEALAISDEVVILDHGRIVERGLPQEIYAFPRSEFTARFLGVSNLLAGTITAAAADRTEVRLDCGTLACGPVADLAPGDDVVVFLRPESFRLSRRQHSDQAWRGTVEFSIYHGDSWDYYVRVGAETLRVRVYREKVGLSRGDHVFLEPEQESALVMRRGQTASAPAETAGPELDARSAG